LAARFPGKFAPAGHIGGRCIVVAANGDRCDGEWSNDLPSG